MEKLKAACNAAVSAGDVDRKLARSIAVSR
jgi:hypothetical protein